MITLSQRLKRQRTHGPANTRISIRDKLLAKEVQEMGQLLPEGCSLHYDNENDLSSFVLCVKPVEGLWCDGCFRFSIQVTEEYNMVVSI